jgi:hypothetical protein
MSRHNFSAKKNFKNLNKVCCQGLHILVRDHQFRVIWVELYVAIRHIGPPKSWNRISKTDREVVTAMERKGSRGCSAGRGGWTCEA